MLVHAYGLSEPTTNTGSRCGLCWLHVWLKPIFSVEYSWINMLLITFNPNYNIVDYILCNDSLIILSLIHRKVYRHVLFIISSRFYITEALRTKSIFKGLLSNRHATSLTTKSKQIHLVFSDLSRITGEQNSNTDPMHSFVTSCFNQWKK